MLNLSSRGRLGGVALVIVSVLIALTSCGAPGESETAPTSSGGGGGFPRTIEHAMGSTVIESKPLRVVALDPSYADAVLLLGTQLVGYVQYRADPDNPFPEYLGDVSAYTGEAVNVGVMAEPNLEKILELQPDLIISAKVRHEALYEQLSKIAPTVMSVSTGPTWKDNIRLLGQAIGEEDTAEAKIGAYQQRAAAIGEQLLAKKPDLTYSLVRFAGEDTARLYSSSSFIGAIMADANIPRPDGAPDTTDNIFVPLSAEQIGQADAGLILVAAYTPPGDEGNASRQQQAAFEANPLWGRLTGDKLNVDDVTFVTSVSVQGAQASLDALADHYGITA